VQRLVSIYPQLVATPAGGEDRNHRHALPERPGAVVGGAERAELTPLVKAAKKKATKTTKHI
jgi:hypothetical protein